MKINLKRTAIAVAVAALAASPAAFAQSVDDQNADADILHNHVVVEDWDTNVLDVRTFETTVVDDRDYDITVDDTRNFETNVENYNENINVNADVNATVDADVDLVLDAAALIRYNGEFNEISNDRDDSWTTDESHTYSSTSSITTDESHTYTSDRVVTADEDVDIDSDIRREQNEHGRSVYLSKDLSVSSDVDIDGDITLTGDVEIDSAAIAVVDGRQTIADNFGDNDILENTASIADDAGGGASGNLGFNVAAGDNNAQDNAAALSAADASFAFGMADAEIFNSQIGAANTTENEGVTNAAGMGGAAFSGASGNIAISVASGNNNAQRNSLAASVATSAYAQASVASDQVTSGNSTTNAGSMEDVTDTVTFTLGGTVGGAGSDAATAGISTRGNAYQKENWYPEDWTGIVHGDGTERGHSDWDLDVEGATENPYNPGAGGIAFDTDEEGVIDLSETELAAALTGTIDLSYQVAVAATNSSVLNGAAFNGASGNIGVNIASGTGNLQSNSLSLAVAQPSTGGGPETPPTE